MKTIELNVVEGEMILEIVSREDGVTRLVLEPVPDIDISVEVTVGIVMVTVSYTVWVSVIPTVYTLRL